MLYISKEEYELMEYKSKFIHNINDSLQNYYNLSCINKNNVKPFIFKTLLGFMLIISSRTY